MGRKKALDWSKLPVNLRYLAVPAEKYGRYQFDNRILDYLESEMSEEEKVELIAIRKKMAEDFEQISSWLDNYDITIHREASLVYFTGHLLALGNDIGVFDSWPWRK